ncbi:MAG: hypothetical protein ABI324_19335, partial [Ktedonobacteraceae bacterium]
MIKETDVDDVRRLVARDRDVATFIMELSQMLERYGAFITTRIFALVLGPYKRRRFERMLLVQELNASSPMKPDSLSNASGDVFEQIGAAFDHVTFWQDRGDLRYLTAEPSSVRKDTLKRVIAL